MDVVSKFHKKLTKYTNTYKKKIMNSTLQDEEKLVFLTIGLSAVNSIIYFVGGLKEANSEYAGFKVKPWSTFLNSVTETNVHSVMKYITFEYLNTLPETKDTLISKEQLEMWKKGFVQFINENPETHLVDAVFPHLGLEEAIRYELPVLTFVTIIDNMFVRLDTQLDNAIKELSKQSK